ncbi:hypothetical protein [Puniceicoccus vermicola]|uniref:Uncharacterized protein n=1 Tax=Puniceicoccus vermicola TaxID=388746 RepID=A0A7X1B3W8_9BACT|nr:hypothetical protein [Puniceicoccus vermicola]MBC2603945.1 hypothetical protein [Puniceicoccus vermicola]
MEGAEATLLQWGMAFSLARVAAWLAPVSWEELVVERFSFRGVRVHADGGR